MAKNSINKNQLTLKIMNENGDKPMSDVVTIIAKELSIAESRARAYYNWGIKKGAKGTLVKTTRKAAKAGSKVIKVPKPKVQGDKPLVTDKTVEELADIKAKNLARLKAVGRKYSKGAALLQEDGPIEDDQLDSFKAPAFLTKDEVKYLV